MYTGPLCNAFNELHSYNSVAALRYVLLLLEFHSNFVNVSSKVGKKSVPIILTVCHLLYLYNMAQYFCQHVSF